MKAAVASTSRHVLAAAACGLAGFVEDQGGDPDALLSGAGFDESLLDDPRAPLDLGDYCALMERAAKETRNDNFGLDFGQQFQPEQLGLIGALALASPTVGAAVEQLARYFPYHQQATETRLVSVRDRLQLQYRITDGRILDRRQDAELTLGMFTNVLRRALGAHWAPEAIHFEHPSPAGSREHAERFRAPVHFGQRMNAIVLRPTGLDRPMPQADLPAMARVRDELVGLSGGLRGLGRLPLHERVKGEIRSMLCEGEPSIEPVAQALGMARWTLQRRLATTGHTFADLATGIRRSLALSYLAERHLGVGDVAVLLGYSETSAFTRAFTRWFGQPPSAVRPGAPASRPSEAS